MRAQSARSARACPICGKPAEPDCAPFCSARCKDIDLHKWLAGAYGIPAAPAEEEGDDDQAAAPEHA